MPSVLIPAHNEEAVLARTLESLISELAPGELDIVVICNGCTDRTSEIAAQYASHVRVLESAEASKVAALNLADADVASFPRMYLDADIVISTDSVRRIFAALDEPGALAAEPVPLLDTSGSHWLVRGWYAVWQQLYGATPGRIGSGVCAVSAEARSRFGEFPAVTADDAYLRAHFGPGEIVHVDGAHSRVVAPRTVGDLIKIKTRSRLGAAELRDRFPDLFADSVPTESIMTLIRRLPPNLWVFVPWYFAVAAITKLRAGSQTRRGVRIWERDESSRQLD